MNTTSGSFDQNGNGDRLSTVRWAPIMGRWEISKARSIYQGPESISAQTPYGIARSSLPLRDGLAKVAISLSRNERTAGGLVFGFQSLRDQYVVVQLGGFGRAYSISEFRPESGWAMVDGAGLISNLEPQQPYSLAVTVEGQRVRMSVDDVVVLETVLQNPLRGTGFGLFGYDDAPVTFADLVIEAKRPNAFVVMPFREPFDTLYKEVIRPEAEQLGFEVFRVDEIHGGGNILDDIRRQIERAHVVVAEISTPNPNVFYELGYAHALDKPAVLLVRREEGKEMPFDIRSYRAIFYDDSIGGKNRVQHALREHLNAILRDS